MLTCDITMSLDGFVTDGIESALEQARAAAAGKDVAPILLGGAPGCSTRSARRLLHGVSLPGRGA